MPSLFELDTYDPNRFLDAVLNELKLTTDAALALRLEVAAPVISNIRHKKLPIGATLLLRIHDETGLSIKELRQLMGDTRRFFHGANVNY